MSAPGVNPDKQRRTVILLTLAALTMLGVGFSSKFLYDTFCKVTGYAGTTRQAETNMTEVIDRPMTISFDSNVSPELPWSFKPEQRKLEVKLGQNGLAYYKVTNNSDVPLVGTATYNVTPIKAAPYFTKTQCFCFTEQRVEPGQTVTMPVLFYVDPLLDEEARLKDVTNITLSYTFFKVDNPKANLENRSESAANSPDVVN